MPVPTAITDLSITPASNSPAGSESITLTDDYLRTLAAFVRQVYNRMTDGTSAATLGDLTTTGNTVLGNASTDTLNVGAGGLVKDAAGNVGVGTVTPSTALTVKTRYSFGAADNGAIRLEGEVAPSGVGIIDQIGGLNFRSGARYHGAGLNTAEGSNAGQYQIDTSGNHLWYTNTGLTAGAQYTPSERMRINPSGQIQIGLSSSGINGRLQIQSNSATENIPLFSNDTRSDAASSFSVTFARQGVAVGGISTTTSGTSYNTTSDRRLKTAIVDAPAAGADIDAIRVRSFDWLADGSHQTYGVIAQELAEVAPYAVHQPADPESMLAVDYSKLVPMLVKEVQSLRLRLAALEARP